VPVSADHARQVHKLYLQAWWADTRSLESTLAVMTGSQYVCGIWDSLEVLIGFGRVVSDGIEKATIYDVIIDEAHQGKGLGRLIIDHIKDSTFCRHTQHIELYCKPEMMPFYSKLGFVDITDEVRLMRLNK